MTSLDDLRSGAPEIARFFEERTTATGLCLLGTVRSDGWPRVSPLELSIIDDRLYVGSMPGAVKARDLQRDARCCLLTPLA
ncbi:MAG TPA: pyridoxamine 5'-phosphate oxidase family protein, partial [Acidimicrobiales bacterium]|nr:pyridoxamine 5'-phosphate oxidase family protein [Acidimicrobiales bacterium]